MESNKIEDILARYEQIEAKTDKLKQENNELKKRLEIFNSQLVEHQPVSY